MDVFFRDDVRQRLRGIETANAETTRALESADDVRQHADREFLRGYELGCLATLRAVRVAFGLVVDKVRP